MTTTAPNTNDSAPADTPLALGSSAGLGPLVERLLKYSDIRRNDPRESREALRDLIAGELADELQAVRKAERESWRALAHRVAADANRYGCEGLKMRCTISDTGALVSWEVDRA
jgi:hypothetical protein